TWSLRRRLVLTVVGLLTVVAALIGVASTLSLHSNLESQLDQRVRAANERAVRVFGDGDAGAPGADPATAPQFSPTPPALPTASPTGPASLKGPGSEVGMVSVVVHGGLTQSGYITDQGTQQRLTADQQAVLLALPPDRSIHTVELPGIGSYRASATTAADDSTVISGLPDSALQATVEAFVLREVLVAFAGVLIAAFGASWLVGRELRPLVRVAATATRVAEQPLSKGEVVITDRVEERDTDPRTEVGQVGSAVNRMLGHVEAALADRHSSEEQVRQFVADASHELRTPLASIRGYTELVRRSPDELPPEARHALDRVESETVRMTTLVSDMLLLARLDAGRPLAVEPVDLVGLAIDAVADAHAAGPDHDWRLDLPGSGPDAPAEGSVPAEDLLLGTEELPEDIEPVEVLGDGDRLRQVLANLLSNARLHTPAGTAVTVTVRRAGAGAVLEVHDDGPGIDEQLRSRLFQRFTRGDASRNRAAGSTSTGLGMAIVHAVVTAHHGTIEVDSIPGSTTFTVRLPATA
ncbi:MAG: HAMP domain-containing histidine kinase, partial [Actinobacteria bacterium]|nr:HAMP domain-containing histidine kinase [Actinomycetota bacterium]